MNRLEMQEQKMGLVINYDKTKYMETGKPTKETYIITNNSDREKVNQIKYLYPLLLITTHRKYVNNRMNVDNKC